MLKKDYLTYTVTKLKLLEQLCLLLQVNIQLFRIPLAATSSGDEILVAEGIFKPNKVYG